MRAVLATAGFLAALQAQACGYCVEDKIAATYDHAVVSRALGQRHDVVFFHIEGTLGPGEDTRRALEAIAESAPGVDKGSARVSVETTTLSLAFNPQRMALVAVQKALEKRFAASRLSLVPLRVMDRPAELKTVKR